MLYHQYAHPPVPQALRHGNIGHDVCDGVLVVEEVALQLADRLEVRLPP